MSELEASNKEGSKRENEGNRADTLPGLNILFIERESILTKPEPTIELNPLFIKEVAYYCLSR